jgi:hypothetical protein
MKTYFKHSPTILGLLLLTAFILAACALPIQAAEPNQPEETNQSELDQSNTISESPTPVVNVSPTPASDEDAEISEEGITVEESLNGLTESEVAGLIFMREEEKLAHDVYLALYDLWGLPLFQNIARSEETHTGAVKNLLDTFNIPDPAVDTPLGVFTDPVLQTLYDELITLGERSLADALKVGGAIEEIDILDLQAALDETDNPDIQRVYANLLRGSENHLRAFTSTLLQQTGETYIPQYMDVSAYDEILASAPARGGRVNNRRP